MSPTGRTDVLPPALMTEIRVILEVDRDSESLLIGDEADIAASRDKSFHPAAKPAAVALPLR